MQLDIKRHCKYGNETLPFFNKVSAMFNQKQRRVRKFKGVKLVTKSKRRNMITRQSRKTKLA